MERFIGLIGIAVILLIAFALSNNRKAINYRLVISGLLLQFTLAIAVMKVPFVRGIFQLMGRGMSKIEVFAREGAKFVFGPILPDPAQLSKVFGAGNGFIFAFNIPATIILVCVLIAVLYHIGFMQKVIALIAKGIYKIMQASGSEALSNIASVVLGQVEAQVLIRPYLDGMTKSELLASMAGSMACISGGILVVYANMGVPAEYLIAASVMAAPGALVIAKIVYPETEQSQTRDNISLAVKSPYTNLIDAISHGASDGMKISINIIAMLVGFIALVAFINFILGKINILLGSPLPVFNLNIILSWLFTPIAYVMGIPRSDVNTVASLMGQKMVLNEFVAYINLLAAKPMLSYKGFVIASFALCGFANFASVGMQIGGIGELVPSKRSQLASLGIKALICGTLSSYLSATIAGLLL